MKNFTVGQCKTALEKNEMAHIDMVAETSTKQFQLSELTEIVSSTVASAGWKRYSVGESSEINYNYRFDLYIRRRNLSELVSKNDDISKKIVKCASKSKL